MVDAHNVGTDGIAPATKILVGRVGSSVQTLEHPGEATDVVRHPY